MELKKLENEVLKLSIEDRGALAEKLILSVDAPSETENLQLWVAEAERRLKELREGTSASSIRPMTQSMTSAREYGKRAFKLLLLPTPRSQRLLSQK